MSPLREDVAYFSGYSCLHLMIAPHGGEYELSFYDKSAHVRLVLPARQQSSASLKVAKAMVVYAARQYLRQIGVDAPRHDDAHWLPVTKGRLHVGRGISQLSDARKLACA